MKRLFLATAIIVSGGGGLASAQTPQPVTETASPTVTTPAPAGEARPAGGEAVAAPRPNDADATGPDKVNGLEVPRMKDPREGGRE
ncbi:hypothetical protein [Methylobacterium sp. J-076]|uniref:hypothetical protein n=1 Tax=Methylobacterium sp. J-076 TaxID=2836655 RepID=UPI001FBAFF12|nr:hypothetical protein [Methylobacterium sp. J-076]MCJ2014781.1 hypothetical protein [Methylobacterium sp. J-076]